MEFAKSFFGTCVRVSFGCLSFALGSYLAVRFLWLIGLFSESEPGNGFTLFALATIAFGALAFSSVCDMALTRIRRRLTTGRWRAAGGGWWTADVPRGPLRWAAMGMTFSCSIAFVMIPITVASDTLGETVASMGAVEYACAMILTGVWCVGWLALPFWFVRKIFPKAEISDRPGILP